MTDQPTIICDLCDGRPSSRSFPSSRDHVRIRDGSLHASPRVQVCDTCYQAFAEGHVKLGWCAHCERWGPRDANSPCGRPYR
jgi:hypothetical protein